MDDIVSYILGDLVYLSPEALVRLVVLALVIEFIGVFGKSFKF